MWIVRLALRPVHFHGGGHPPRVDWNRDDRVHWQNIHVGRDFGTQLEVLDGLAENTKVVVNPTDDLREGLQVQVKPSEPPKGNGGQSPGGQ